MRLPAPQRGFVRAHNHAAIRRGRKGDHAMSHETTEDTATAWMSGGNCRNYPPAVFFPSDGVGVDRARKICTDCPVLDQCLEYALEERIEHGVWGGCSERERRRILKRRKVDLSVG
jgi:WhiB family transcriptional regulator, redox-sensing transcriptional regulator